MELDRCPHQCWLPPSPAPAKPLAYTRRQVHPGTPDERARAEAYSRLIVADPDGKNAHAVPTATGSEPVDNTLGAPNWR